jgi:hypothetical protein
MADAGIYDSDAHYFLERVEKYPWTAKAPTTIRPENVRGDHMSVRLCPGWRVWGWRTSEERHKFVTNGGGSSFP